MVTLAVDDGGVRRDDVPPAEPNRQTAIVTLQFSIQDTGVGMTATQLQQIFTPFEQVGDVGRRAEGTGLGLAISKQLVELMGGVIKVTSAPGCGSTFWFSAVFPVTVAVPAQDDHAPRRPARKTPQDVPAEIIAPPRHELEALIEFAMFGLILRLQERAAALERADVRYRPFARKLQELAEDFEDQQIIRFVQSYLEQTA